MIVRRAFGLGLAALAAGCVRDPGLGALAAGERARLAEVRSGEVLILEDGLEVRLAGLEGPNGAEPLAGEARAALLALCQGREVSLHYGGLRRDRYGRALAHVKAGGRWAQGALLEAGLARVRTYADNRAMAAAMLRAEAAARVAGRGLWALPGYGVLLPQEARSARGFQIVEGRVARVLTGETALIDLVGGLALTAPGGAFAEFALAGKGAEDLRGRLVRARGTVSGSRLRLDHPEALELLAEA